MRVTLPYPPSVNNLYFTVGRRRVLSNEGRAYKQKAAMLALAAGMRPLAGPIAVVVDVYRPRKAGDLDNSLKSLLDSLKGIAFQDDSQIVELQARRHDDKGNPRAEVTIEVSELVGTQKALNPTGDVQKSRFA